MSSAVESLVFDGEDPVMATPKFQPAKPAKAQAFGSSSIAATPGFSDRVSNPGSSKSKAKKR